jgi:nitrite reductase/ring-hydroxylating ferredoxin subunit
VDGCGGLCMRESSGGHDAAGVSRRGLLLGSAGAVAVVALAGCASGESPGTGQITPTGSATPGMTLASTTDIPVGGGKVVTTPAGPFVVTHPDEDQYLVFSGKCTHQGNTVSEVKENEIHCDWHGSVFDASTGQVLEGPATRALPSVASRVQGGEILLG